MGEHCRADRSHCEIVTKRLDYTHNSAQWSYFYPAAYIESGYICAGTLLGEVNRARTTPQLTSKPVVRLRSLRSTAIGRLTSQRQHLSAFCSRVCHGLYPLFLGTLTSGGECATSAPSQYTFHLSAQHLHHTPFLIKRWYSAYCSRI